MDHSPTGLTPASAGFGSSFKGGGSPETNWAWASYEMPSMAGYSVGGYGGSFLAPETREHRLAAAVAVDLVQSDPVIAAIVEQLSTQALGEGLTLSLRLAAYADALGMTPDEARTISSEIELAWRLYSQDPREVDAHGTHDLASLAYAGFRSYLTQGELLAAFPFQRSPDARFGSKVQLMAPSQIASDRTLKTDYGWVFEGVCYNTRARVDALEIRDQPLGSINQAATPKRVPLFTTWGRRKIAHLYDLIAPNSPRGISPLAVALTPAKTKATISELTTGSYALQNTFGAVITADMSPARAFQGLQVNDELGGTVVDPYIGAVDSRARYYSDAAAGKVQLGVGKIVHLHPGDKLELTQPRAAGQEFEQIDTALLRSTAAAAGLSYDQLASDYSKTSFSAAKLSQHVPFMINLRRRAAIAGRFYQATFDCWLEEAIELKILTWKGTKDFWDVRKIVSGACTWRGPPKASADPLKDAEAAIKRVNAGLSTMTRECAELGEDFDSIVAERKAEIETLKAAGLWQVTEAVDGVTKQEVDRVQEDVETAPADLPPDQRDTLDELQDNEP